MYQMYEKIGNIMESYYTPRLQGSTTVADALEVMDEYEAEVIGVECECDFIGVFSRADLERQIMRWNLHPKGATLYEVVAYNPPYVTADASVRETYNAMLAYQWEYMPVVSGKKLLGIAILSDIRNKILDTNDTLYEDDSMSDGYTFGVDFTPEHIETSEVA